MKLTDNQGNSRGRIYLGFVNGKIHPVLAGAFPPTGTHLQRYAGVFNAVEITKAFEKAHAAKTYQGWANSVPADFRFSIKMPQQITHELALRDAAVPLEYFIREISGLGKKLGAVLVQLPPGLGFNSRIASDFFKLLRTFHKGTVVCEPRDFSWFAPDVDDLLASFQIARVAASPAVAPDADIPGGWDGVAYYRWHGAPIKYESAYKKERIEVLANTLNATVARGIDAYCIFGNMAKFAGTVNALEMRELVDWDRWTQDSTGTIQSGNSTPDLFTSVDTGVAMSSPSG